jgi:hypothetical protein
MARDEEILKRRARFISAAAILAAGCSRDQATTKPVAVPSSESKPTASSPAESKAPPAVKPPPDRPPLDPKVSTAALAKRADAAARIEKVNKAVEEAAGAIPAGCPLHDPACRARFKIFHDDLAKLRDDAYNLNLVRCPAKAPDDKAIEDMLQRHQDWLYRWIHDIEKAGRAAADVHEDAGSVWDELRGEAESAHPHPCLKFACP